MAATYNKFEYLPYIPYKIFARIIENDSLCKLLYYSGIDCLDKPNLTQEQKVALIWGGVGLMDDYNIFLSDIQPDAWSEAKTYIKIYKALTKPVNHVEAIVSYQFDILYGSKNSLVEYNNIKCNRGDMIEMELMKSLNGEDVAGVGYLVFNARQSSLSASKSGIGNNSTFVGRSIIMSTIIVANSKEGCVNGDT